MNMNLFMFKKNITSTIYVCKHEAWIGSLNDLNIRICNFISSSMGTIKNLKDDEQKYYIINLKSSTGEKFVINGSKSCLNNIVIVPKEVYLKYGNTKGKNTTFITLDKDITLKGKSVYSNNKCVIKC